MSRADSDIPCKAQGASSRHGVISRIATQALVTLGVGAVLAAAFLWFGRHGQKADTDAAAVATLSDAGNALRQDIKRAVAPAVERTKMLASSGEVIRALQGGDSAVLTGVVNRSVTSSTEVDAIALFDVSGRIVAINTVYASGQPIAPERVSRIMGMDFDEREIIQRCVRNERDVSALEFQTTCDITPAFFDSSGLSVAYSEPVRDPKTGARLGVISTRLRFERLSALLEGRQIAGSSGKAYFVGDQGQYFSEAINSGRQAPPIAVDRLHEMVAPVVGGSSDNVFTQCRPWYVTLFAMKEMRTLENGGIHVLLLADEAWMQRSVGVMRELKAGVAGLVGCLLVIVGYLIRLSIELQAQRHRYMEASVRAEAASNAKSSFLANMSHEIRTPMTAIIGFSDLLMDPTISDAERAGAINTIRASGEHLLHLINDILDLSKIEAGHMAFESVRCSPATLLADVAALMNVRAAEKSVRLDVRVESPVPGTILSDPLRVKQAIFNLMGNAIKFTPQGSVTVTMRYNAGAGLVSVAVTDTGIGMTPEQVKELFQPFKQGDESTSRRFGGTGLGLCITKYIAETLGGRVEVVSEFGRGSTFSFFFAANEPETMATLSPRPAVVATLPMRPSLQGTRVLLVEDGADNRRLVTMFLSKAGAQVEHAEDGKRGLDRALEARDKNTPFDVILMDMQMPVMDGVEATTELRRRGYQGAIVALTANAMEQDAKRCFDAGCDAFLTKPINRDALIDEISRRATRRLAA